MRRLSSCFPIVGEYDRMICLIIILSCFLNLNNLILCTAYVDPRYFAEHTGYLISSNYGDCDDDAVWAGRGPELIWQLA